MVARFCRSCRVRPPSDLSGSTKRKCSELDHTDAIPNLEARLSTPDDETIATLAEVPGDFVVLGAGGKMGPSLTAMLRRASEAAGTKRTIYAVSRFSDEAVRTQIDNAGAQAIAADLLEPGALDTLPDAENVIYMTGQKFGTRSAAGATWATNAYLPGAVCVRYPRSRLLCFSTGNVYPFVSPSSGGSREDEELAPVGEYGTSAMARERVVDYFSQRLALPAVIVRLNYATEMRYGVLVDLAQKVWRNEPIDLAMGYFNCIWQQDANNIALRSLRLADVPARPINMTGLETLSVRDVAQRLASLLDREVSFTGVEGEVALLSNAAHTAELLGPPKTTIDQLLEWTADWIRSDGPTYNKPTHFEVRDGKF